ncbi:hypothetical protein PVAP13_5KG207100 [Panicum virgatum]|uniref:Uncharacterized protein n=1 Tax=Panicum virgatum TaxID=38727 RepID=A0A8T0SEX3_PANVG|nr:hypothetical protein PVAP13_5KG207100 [Panicum virgatum]
MFGYVFNFADAAAFTPVTPASITPSVRRLPGGGRNLCALDSRHGRVLFRKKRPWENKSPWENKCSLLVWDAVAGKKQEVRLPEMFSAPEKFSVHDWSACILCNAPDCDHIDCGGGPYNIVLVGTTYDVKYTYGFVYSSVTLAWTATAVLDASAQERCHRGDVISIRPSTVVGGCIYFRTRGTSIIRYQFDGSAAERLSFIELPNYDARGAVLVPAGGRLQFAALRKRNDERVRLRELLIDSDGAPQWIRLEQFVLPVPCIQIAGFVEEPPCLILGTKDEGTICMNMETFKWDKLPKANGDVLPIMSFYPPLSAGTPREPDEDSPEEEVSRFRMFSRSVLRRTADK